VLQPEIRFSGNLVDDPTLRFVGEAPVAGFTVAHTERKKDGNEWVDGEVQYWRVSAWRKLAENVCDSLGKGDRVVVVGRTKANVWEDKHQQKRRDIQIEADEVAPSLLFAVAKPKRNNASGPKRQGSTEQPANGKYEPSESPW
jgi:single-strand DNA-binding protein